MRTFALVPAGGQSVRMGRPKLALPLGGHTVIEHVIAALRRAGIEPILLVLGPHVAELRPLAETAGASVHVLPEATPDMRTTVMHGLRWLADRFQPHPDDAWLLVPADHPTLRPGVVQELLEARQADPRHSIFIPTFTGKRGHPALIAWKHVAGMQTLPPDQGLNVYLRQHAAQTAEVPVDEPEVLLDLDTPEDYERLRRSWPEAEV
jgi:CTP:molybdopterin cytidylyltransferase MocA